MASEDIREGREGQQSKKSGWQLRAIKCGRPWAKPQGTSLGQIGGVETGPMESIIAKVRPLPDVGWGPSEGSWDGNEEPTKSPGERDKGDEEECWESRGDGRLFMDWESGDGLCRHAFPNLRGRQTWMRKHQQVNYRITSKETVDTTIKLIEFNILLQ